MTFHDICTGCGRPVFVFKRDKYLGFIGDIARNHGVTVAQILSNSRERNHVFARQECYYALHNLGLSSSQIGKVMDRDHTTILYGIRVFQERIYRMDEMLKRAGNDDCENIAQPAQ